MTRLEKLIETHQNKLVRSRAWSSVETNVGQNWVSRSSSVDRCLCSSYVTKHRPLGLHDLDEKHGWCITDKTSPGQFWMFHQPENRRCFIEYQSVRRLQMPRFDHHLRREEMTNLTNVHCLGNWVTYLDYCRIEETGLVVEFWSEASE